MPTTATQPVASIRIRRGSDRGQTQIDWLDSRHSFSFGQYHDPANMGFRALRVINDDVIAPGGGFGEHPHRDMEILTWVLEGSLQHRDSLGHGAVVTHGTLQNMTAGRGIRHSEFNASQTEPVHLLQVWILPRAAGLPPRYGQTSFDAAHRTDKWGLVASGDGRDGSIKIEQDADMYVTELKAGKTLSHTAKEGRYLFLHVARGEVTLGEHALQAGDAAAISGMTALAITAKEDAEVLLFDLA